MKRNKNGHTAPDKPRMDSFSAGKNPLQACLALFLSFYAVALMPLSLAAQGPPDLEKLTNRYAVVTAALQGLSPKLAAIRAAFQKEEEVVALYASLNEAIKARAAKAKSDPKILEAQLAVTNAAAAAKKAYDKAFATTPEYIAIAKELSELEQAQNKLKAEERSVQDKLSNLQRKFLREPALEKLAQAKVTAAAAASGKEAGSIEFRAALRATNAFNAAITAKTAAEPEGAALTKRLSQLPAELRANARAQRAAQERMSALRWKLLARKDKVLPGRQAELDAQYKLKYVTMMRTKAESEAVDKAETAHENALEARFAADPAAAALRKQVAALISELAELAIDIRLARKAADR